MASKTAAFRAAAQDTTYFGGTFWAADSGRWEAIQDSVWTFDSGVGSNFNHSDPFINPYKGTSLHAYMEGWIGIDNTYSDFSYFRRLSVSDFTSDGGTPCVLGGSYSFWCGVLPSEALALSYSAGQGYGNDWNVCIKKTYAYNGSGNVSLSYDYVADTEWGFDYTYAIVDTLADDNHDVTVNSTTGPSSGTANHTLVPGSNLRSTSGTYTIKFCVTSDGVYSDEDGAYPTTCGALAIDNVSVTGGGVSDFSDFETGANGWGLSPSPPGAGGDWSDLQHLNDLPASLAPCTCALSESVLVFEDTDVSGHGPNQSNIAMSPWIDLKAAGLDGVPGKFIQADVYGNVPLLDYVFVETVAQWYPQTSPVTGLPVTSPITSYGQVFWLGEEPTCTVPGALPFRAKFGHIIDAGAEQVRIGLGVVSWCSFFPNCTGITNASPYFDNVRLGVYGSPDAPFISYSPMETPQDAFPVDGTLAIDAPGRIDCNTVKGFSNPQPGSCLGDTLVVEGYADEPMEVRVVFAVDPGPGIDAGAFNTWLTAHTPENTWQGLSWYSARMDTAQQGASVATGVWMTAYHEADPNFTGTDTDPDMSDLAPNGTPRLANDMFPDDLFTPGTRLCLYYKTRYLSGSTWFFAPDTTSGNYLEAEILPSSMNGSGEWNCVLYVDHFDGRGAQPIIEAGLASVLTGGSSNFEGLAWDRFDVRAPSSGQASFGRLLDPDIGVGGSSYLEYGATVTQALGYTTIIWNSGNLDAYNLSSWDSYVLGPWLEHGTPDRGLYLSGDGIANSMAVEGSGLPFMSEILGVGFSCSTVRETGCGTSVSADDACIQLDPVSGRHFGTSTSSALLGNGCPELRSFDLISRDLAAADPQGNADYNSTTKGVVSYASISNQGANFKTVLDGGSLHYLRATDCVSTSAIDQRLSDVLGWFGGGTTCSAPDVTGIEDGPAPVATTPRLRASFPNPFRTTARISYDLPASSPVRIRIFDLNGRLVRTLVDRRNEEAGEHEVVWDRLDDAGAVVSAGVYFYSMIAGNHEEARRLIVIN